LVCCGNKIGAGTQTGSFCTGTILNYLNRFGIFQSTYSLAACLNSEEVRKFNTQTRANGRKAISFTIIQLSPHRICFVLFEQ
jgi:hypothetical protein